MQIEEILIALDKLSKLNFDGWKESDVREDYIKPLLNCLGYEKNTAYDINREDQHLLNNQFLMVGRQKIQIDYKLVIRKKSFWLIEAKSAENKNINIEEIFQAQLYAIHPEVKAFYFIVTNGWELQLFKSDTIDEMYNPILKFNNSELQSNFNKLNDIVGSKNIISHLKKDVLNNITKIFSTELNVDKLNIFSNEVRKTLDSLKPVINENIKIVRKEKEQEHQNIVKQIYDTTSVDEILKYYLRFPVNGFQLSQLVNSLKIKIEGNEPHENTKIVSDIMKIFLGRPSNNHRKNLIDLLIMIYHNYNTTFDNASQNVFIERYLHSMIYDSIAGFPSNQLFKELSNLDGNLHRIVYKLSICTKELIQTFEKQVNFKKNILNEEDIIYQNPHLASERLKWVEDTISLLYNKMCRLNIDELGKINELLVDFEKESINDVFKVEFKKNINTDQSDLSFYEGYNDSFDYFRSGLFSRLYSQYKTIEPIIDSRIIDETIKLVVKKNSEPKYNINYADYFLFRHWIANNQYKIIDSNNTELITNVLEAESFIGFIEHNFPKNDPKYRISGNFVNKFYRIYFNPNIEEKVVNIIYIEETS